MNFPITLDAIRDYENDIASQIEEEIYQLIKPHLETSVSKIAAELTKQIQRNVRGRSGNNVYKIYIGSSNNELANFTLEDVEKTIRRRFTDEMIRTSFPGAEFVVEGGHYYTLKWTLRA